MLNLEPDLGQGDVFSQNMKRIITMTHTCLENWNHLTKAAKTLDSMRIQIDEKNGAMIHAFQLEER